MAETQTSLPTPNKRYSRTKLLIGITSALLSFVVLLILVAGGYSKDFAEWAGSVTSNSYAALLLFAVAVGFSQTVFTLPLSYYSGYVVEHHYGLSNQSFWRWVWERLKGLLVAAPIGAVVLIVIYFCLHEYGSLWWLPVSIVLTGFSVVLARLAPVIIMPLFYKFTPVADGSLKERIMRLCAHASLRVEGVFSFNLSKNTRKANAGFTGIGKSRRIILGDTLVKEFSEEEIETVFAHELGHYKHRHIIIGICIGTVSTFAGLFVTARLYEASLAAFGFSLISELAALPLLAIWLSVFALVTSPLGNMLSRHHERQADAYAVKATGNGPAFISALRKLAAMNLADPEPHPLVEFLLYSHPAIAKRIKFVEALSTS
jgi:STE24 endopeptidase